MFAFADDSKPRFNARESSGLWNAMTAFTRPKAPAFEVIDVTLDDMPSADEQDAFARETLSALRFRPSVASLADADYGSPLAKVVDLRSFRLGKGA